MQEWELDEEAQEDDHYNLYGFLSTTDFEEEDSWAEQDDAGDSWSWDYTDPLNNQSF